MARRKTTAPAGSDDGQMPQELRRRPATPEQIDRWLKPGERMPNGWDLGGEAWWRVITAHGRWSAARRAWREQNDPGYWWYQGRRAGRDGAA